MKPLQARLMRLERVGNQSCSVSIPAGMTHDEVVVREAVADHKRRTGRMGPVLLAEPEMTEALNSPRSPGKSNEPPPSRLCR